MSHVRAKIVLKVGGKKEIRRITLTDFVQFSAAVNRFTGKNVDDLKLCYLDRENDWITFSESSEFEEMKGYIDGECVRIKVTEPGFVRNDFGHPRWGRIFHPMFMAFRGPRGGCGMKCGPEGKFGKCWGKGKFGGACPKNGECPRRKILRERMFNCHPSMGHGGRRGRGGPRHFGIICDGCEKRNWRGLRMKCKCCADFDLCGQCYRGEAKLKHDSNHEFVRIPLVRRGGRCGWRRGRRGVRFPWEVVAQIRKLDKVEEKVEEEKKEEAVIEPEKKEGEKIVEKEQEEEETEGEEEEEVVDEIKVPELPDLVEEEVQEEEIKDEEEEVKEEKKKFVIQMDILKQMGFIDEDRNNALLEQENGDIKKVLEKLLSLQ